jgi:hypothetical protein
MGTTTSVYQFVEKLNGLNRYLQEQDFFPISDHSSCHSRVARFQYQRLGS